MCILCAIQRWSRRGATGLLRLSLPLIALWSVSQLFPPGFRFEVSYPRLACALVLLSTLCWYEVAMPRISAWHARRTAVLRRRQLSRAAELHKLRRTATRRCRNCLSPYRDQNPAGQRFTCSCCGHVSRRPVLDLPDQASTPAFIANWQRLSSVLRWLWALLLPKVDCSTGLHGRKGLLKKGDASGGFQESRGEKARRKAEEKRLAKLEKEMLEEEERMQREDVARLVEERRKLRDEVLEVERQHLRSSSAGEAERDRKREAERRKHEKRREKDKGSNKSCSDTEESRKSEDTKAKTDNERWVGHAKMEESIVEPNKSSRYFGRMKNSLLSSSRGTIFGRASKDPLSTPTKHSTFASGLKGHRQKLDGSKKSPSVYLSHGSEQTPDQAVSVPSRPTVPRKSWRSLFTRSSAVHPCLDRREIVFEDNNVKDVDSCFVPGIPRDSIFSPVSSQGHRQLLEEPDIFEDPCYVPDPISSLGPISEPLYHFPSDLGPGFLEQSDDTTPGSQIKSTISTVQSSCKSYASPGQMHQTPMPRDFSNVVGHGSESKQNEWQMWGKPLAQDAFSFVGGPNRDLLSGVNVENVPHHFERDMPSHSSERSLYPFGYPSPQGVHFRRLQNCALIGPPNRGLNGHGEWIHTPVFQSFPVKRIQALPLRPTSIFSRSEADCAPASKSVHQLEHPATYSSIMDCQDNWRNRTAGIQPCAGSCCTKPNLRLY